MWENIWSPLGDEKLNCIILMYYEGDTTLKVDFTDMVEKFAQGKRELRHNKYKMVKAFVYTFRVASGCGNGSVVNDVVENQLQSIVPSYFSSRLQVMDYPVEFFLREEAIRALEVPR
ncbi:hypothetical protein PR048_019417 [Dryococelus australis]|uniref:Uncharacterized protein n=1 Tax=Dryococelus australis TaxID=614101 RepID=A0ABQ9H3J4_9NEOP|nr:hypothetical protein PR048_019417 [Dryococelus australis]